MFAKIQLVNRHGHKILDKTSEKTHLRSIKNGSDLSGTKGKSHVSRVSSGNRVHGKTTSLVSGSGKGGLGVSINSSAHLQRHVLTNAESSGGAESINTGSSDSCCSKGEG